MSAHSGGHNRKKTIGGINMTPFVDIVLVLLVIFMMTAKIMSDPKALKVELPSAKTGEAAKERVLSLVIDADGNMHLDGQAISDTAFESVIARAKIADRVRISADGATPHRAVVHAMDMFGKGGISHLSFAVVE